MRAAWAAIALLTVLPAHAETLRTMSVKGQAEAEVPADFIKISASLSGEDKQPDRAKQDVDLRMNKLLPARSAGACR